MCKDGRNYGEVLISDGAHHTSQQKGKVDQPMFSEKSFGVNYRCIEFYDLRVIAHYFAQKRKIL